MATEKTVLEQVNNFLDGIYNTAVETPIAFGDFIARISGYRDYQFTSGSVINGLSSDLIQKQTMNEMRILYEVFKNDSTRNLIIDKFLQDIQNRPAYYLGSIGTSMGISSTISISKDLLSTGILKASYFVASTGTKAEQKIHELYGTTENFFKTNNNEFMNLINNNMSNTPWLSYTNNPNKISFSNKDGSFEVWEKINGNFVQTLKTDSKYISADTLKDFSQSTPTTQTQTTIYETASKLNTTVSKLEQSNPWLKSRSSDNLSTIFSNSSNKSLLVKDNTGKSYTYTYNSSSDTFENQTPIATADDAINFIANYQGSMSDLQNIQNAVKDAYENHGLSKEYYDAFMASFNTYVAVNTQNNNVTTQPTGNSTRIDKNAFYYYNNINDTALSLANKTFTVLDSNNKALSVQDLKKLDINSDKQLSGTELINLKAWIDANENGIVDINEINTLSANNITNIEEIDYVLHGNLKTTLTDTIILTGEGDDFLNISIENGKYIVYSGDDDDLIRIQNNRDREVIIFGGKGNDTIEVGGENDYIDGGSGADLMKGGLGNDIYIVNSINDDIKEDKNAGNDTIFSSVNYVLERNVETLRLMEGYNINGTGNSGNNTLIGNSANNILDGLNGNDTMIGGFGDDAYYVDSENDVVIEKASGGNDTINSYISTSLANLQNVENIQLLDYLTPEFGNINGKDVVIYGHPKRVELDYTQGDAVSYKSSYFTLWYEGTCSLVAISNLLTQAGKPTSEADVVNLAIQKQLTTTTGASSARGGTTRVNQINVLKEFGIDAKLFPNNQYNPNAIAQYVLSGRGVLVAVNAGQLWGNQNTDDGSVDHVVLVSGVVYDTYGNLNGFYIADSGRGMAEDTNRYLSLTEFSQAVAVPNAYFIYTTQPILDIWNKNINAVGNDANNILYGNIGNNELFGENGDDTLNGGKGDDYLEGGLGNDIYKFALNDGKDILYDVDGNDSIVFSDIKKSEIKVLQIGNNLVIYGINSIGSLTIIDWFNGNKVENITFSDGTLSIANIEALIQEKYSQNNYQIGTQYDDELVGYTSQNQIEGGAGNDTIKGKFGSDVLKGDAGNDTIYGYKGKDLLYGGDGDDLLNGGDESDLMFGGTGNDTLQGGIGDDIIEGEDGNDLLQGDEGRDLIYGGAGIDLLSGGEGNDLIYGDNGNDTLYGNNGDDTLSGGEGNDKLSGESGDDSYCFGNGDGNDIILDTQGFNKVVFAEGITQSNITVKRDNSNLIIVLNSGETLTIDSWYVLNNITLKPIQEFIFADGTKLDSSSIEKLSKIFGTSGNDTIFGTIENDNIYGLGGDDYIYAGDDTASSDYIDGGAGNDKLYAVKNANSTLYGNTGNDTLNGGSGNDTFVFGLGDGNDILYGNDVNNNTDVIAFKENITLQTLNIIRNNQDLILKTSVKDDITIKSFFSSSSAAKIDQIVFTDRTILNYEQILQQTNIKSGTSGDDILSFFNLGSYDANYELNNAYGLDNTLYGFDGNDTLYGGSGNDILDGGIGNDTLFAGSGNDTLDGGLGNDTLFGNLGNDTFYGGLGNDFLSGGNDDDRYIFGLDNDNDVISDSMGNNSVYFLEGIKIDSMNVTTDIRCKDLILSFSSNNSILTIRDWFNPTYPDSKIKQFIFADGTILNSSAIEKMKKIMGTVNNDYLFGTNTDDSIYGQDGNDRLYGGLGNDYIHGENGDDTLYGNEGNDYIDGGIGNDTLDGENGDDTLYGNEGNDYIVGENGNDTLYGNEGNDLIYGEEGSDILYGGAGNDMIGGYIGNDTMFGETGDDTIYAGEGSDTYIFSVGDGKDIIGEYTLNSTDIDKIIFKEGISKDKIIVKLDNSNNKNIIIHLNESDSITIQDWYKVYNNIDYKIEQFVFDDGSILTSNDITNMVKVFGTNSKDILNGTDFNDIVYGYDGNDTLYGGSGNDTLYGNEGNDTIYGYDGDDTIDGGSGADTLDGGKGTDTLYGYEGNDTIYGYGGDDYIDGGSGDDVLDGRFDNVYDMNYSMGNDTIYGREGNDELSGGEGNDTIDGGIGNDYLFGGKGLDKLYGNDGIDTIFGCEGNDYIDGGNGDDYIEGDGTGNYYLENNTLYGREGNDRLIGAIGDDYIDGGIGNDYLFGYLDDDTLCGNDGNDILDGGYGKDILDGGYDTDSLYGSDGNDTLLGSKGNDTLDGSNGSDNYVFSVGDGQDIINEFGSITDIDKVIFNQGILKDNILVKFDNSNNKNIIIQINEFDSIKIKDWYKVYNNIDYKIEQFIFADGSILTLNDITNMIKFYGTNAKDRLYGTDLNNIMYGYEGDDTIEGYDGDDNIDGGTGADTLDGGEGTDILSAGEGNDTLDAGWSGNDILNGGSGDDFIKGNGENNTLISEKGNDLIYGEKGNDIYIFRIGDGVDKITDIDGIDTIRLIGNNFNINSISTKYLNDDVVINFKDNLTDSITIVNGRWDPYFKIETMEIMDENNNIVYTSSFANIVNIAPIINYITPLSITEDAKIITGTIFASDVDSSTLTYSTTSIIDGFTLNTNGTYSFNPAHSAYQSLKQGEIKTITIPVSVSDGSLSNSKNLVITVIGTNDKPIISTITPISTTEDAILINGTITATDTDNSTLTYSTTSIIDGFTLNSNGTYSFNLAHSSYQSLKQGEIKNLTIPVSVSDGSLTDSKDLVITITGTNDKPILSVITPIITTEDVVITNGTITATDVDSTTLTYSTTAAIAGFTLNSNGTYSFNPAHSSYQSLKQGEIKNLTIPVSVSDGSLTDSKDLVITITGTNDKPILSVITPINVNEDAVIINGTITATDLDNINLIYSTASIIDGFTLNSNGTYSFNPAHNSYQSLKQDEIKTITIPITVSDGSLSDSKNLVITLTGTNDKPTIAIEIDSYIVKSGVAQSGNIGASDIDNDTLNYTVSTRPSQGTITVDANGNWKYTAKSNYAGDDNAIITVNDGKGGSVTKTFSFRIENVINGTRGDDLLSGTQYDDTLIGGIGNDTLYGSFGNDTYTFGLGDNTDVVVEEPDWEFGSFDKIVFKEGVNASNLKVIVNSDNMNNVILQISETDKLIVQDWFDTRMDSGKIEEVEFADGTILYKNQLNNMIQIMGSDENDYLNPIMDNYQTTIYGLAGDDILCGNDQTQTMIGGTGNDTLFGFGGSNTYIFGLGDGNDSITLYRNGNDKIIFKEAITLENTIFKIDNQNRANLIVQINNQDSININNWFSNDTNKIDEIEFSDGRILNKNDIAQLIQIAGTDGSDRLYGTEGNDTINGFAGNDTLDAILGNDILIGGKGNDTLSGSVGSDTYIFNVGDGQDVINEFGNYTDIDKIIFKQGISKDNVVFGKNYSDLKIIVNANDNITIKNWFDSTITNYQIEQFIFADGSILTANDITKRINILGTVNNDWLFGTKGNDIFFGDLGNDSFYGMEGDDTYIFKVGDGTDSITESNGIDTLRIIGKNFKISDISFKYNSSDLILYFKESTTDIITIKNYKENSINKIETIEIMDENNNIIFTSPFANIVNIAPKALNDTATVSEDNSVIISNIFVNDSDEDGHKIAIDSFTQAKNGIVIKNTSGTFTYTPNKDYYGTDSFTYTLIDEFGLKSTSATVSITIDPKNDAPILSITPISIIEDSAIVNGVIKAIDSDSINLIYSTTVIVDGFTLNANGTYIFNPAHSVYQSLKQDEIKILTIPVTVSDGSLRDTKDLVITLKGTNDAPIVTTTSDNFTFKNNIVQTGNIGASDIDKDILSYTVSTTPNNGTITIDTSGNWRYTAKSNYVGVDKAIVIVSDGKGGSVIKTLNFTVQGSEIVNNLSTTASISVGGFFENTIDVSNDQDWIKINLQTGKTYDVNLAGITLSDSYLRGIYDKNGALLSSTQNDDSNGTLNSYVKFKASYTGDYYVSAGAYSSNTGTYKLDVQEVNINVITGTSSNNNLIGTITNDTIHALSGNDTIQGNKGNDRLYGESGNDTYKFCINDGIDTIYDYSGTDNIVFDSTVSKSNIAFYLQGSNDLAIQYSANDLITVSTWNNSPNKIEKVQLSDGNYLTSTDIDKLIQSMSSYATTKGISLSSVDSVSKNADLMTMIASSWHK